MKIEIVCPYCKKIFEADIVVRLNPYMKENPSVSEIGVSAYYKKEEGRVK